MTSNPDAMPALSLCPLCRRGAQVCGETRLFYIECSDFCCETAPYGTEAEAIAAWNNRPGETAAFNAAIEAAAQEICLWCNQKVPMKKRHHVFEDGSTSECRAAAILALKKEGEG